MAITTCVCRLGSFSLLSQWSKAAATTPRVSTWATPLVPIRVRATSRSITVRTSARAVRWTSYRTSRVPSSANMAPPPLELPSFSLYDMRMVSEEQIQKWADEAEAGYDVDELKRRGRGRPGRGAEPMQVVAVRLTGEELDALDAAAAKNDMSRSEAIRAALAHFAA